LPHKPSDHLAAPVMRPDSLPRLWRYINLLLTYLQYNERLETVALTSDGVRGTGPAYGNAGRPGLRSAECGDLFVPWTKTTRLGRWSFVTHCRVTFAPRPSVTVSFEHGSTLVFSDWPFTDFSSENYCRDWTELKWSSYLLLLTHKTSLSSKVLWCKNPKIYRIHCCYLFFQLITS